MRKRKIGILVLTFVFSFSLVFGGTVTAKPSPIEKAPGHTDYVPDEIIVKFKPGVSEGDIAKINSRHGTSIRHTSRIGGFKSLKIPKGRTVLEMVSTYKGNPNVEYAEPNYIAQALMIPNDNYYHYQWHLDDTLEGGNPYGGANGGGINIEPAWDLSTGSGVVVAVIDTGVAYENYGGYYLAPDLARKSFVAGYDFINNDAHPNDDEGHGTHVTGTIAQSTNNHKGVAGVAFDATVMPVKVLDSNGMGTYAEVSDGIYYAADNGAQVINMSLGGSSPSATLEDALAHAYEKGVTIVCASGNDGSSNFINYPAAYDDYCIAVGATRYDEWITWYSNAGASLDLVAPGGAVWADQNYDGYADGVLQQTFSSTTNDWIYWFAEGTSMAAPHVSGVAALVMANGVTSPDNVREALQSTAEDKWSTGWDPYFGWGIVDAYAAVMWTPPQDTTPPAITSGPTATNVTSSSATITWITDEPSDSLVEYGTASGNYKNSTEDTAIVTNHSVELTGLQPNTTYYYIVTSKDEAQNSVTSLESWFITEPQLTNNTMHVENIDMSVKTRSVGRKKSPKRFIKALATVTIADANGNPVEEATVYGSWSDATSDTDSGKTDANGQVTLESDKIQGSKGTTYTFTFMVDDVVLSGWTGWQYDPGANVETEDSTTPYAVP